MQKLIIVRHGEYNLDKNNQLLTDSGKEKLQNLAEKIKKSLTATESTTPFIAENSIIITSDSPRAMQSSDILKKILEIKKVEKTAIINEDVVTENNYEDVLDLIKKYNSCDTIILITHAYFTNHFPEYFLKEYLKIEKKLPLLDRGSAYIIDCQSKKVEKKAKRPVPKGSGLFLFFK